MKTPYKVLIVFGVVLVIPLLQAQVGPTVFTPRLTVSPGPLTVSTGLTTVQDLTISGTCTGCGTTGAGNPTASLGLSAINGSATTFMRSDAAPALSQAITPTWTGTHNFTNASTGIGVSSITPGIRMTDSDAGVDSKQWLFDVNAGNYRITTRTDAGGAGAVPLQMNRTGTVVDSIAFTGTALSLNGITSLLGTNQLLGNAAFTARAVGIATPQIQVEGNNNSTSSFSLIRNNPSSGGGYITLGHSRGAAAGGTTIVNNNDVLGFIDFAGADGVDMTSLAAAVVATVDGTPGADDMPGRLVFQTTPDGSATSVERMRINNVGALGFAGANFGTSGQVLVSGGSTTTPAWATPTSQVAGSDTQVQFNNAGAFGAEATFIYDPTTNTLTVEDIIGDPNGSITANGNLVANTTVRWSLTGRNLGTGAVNDYDDSVTAIRTDNTGAVSLSGMIFGASNTAGNLRYIINAGAADLTILNESASSSANNRFTLPGGTDLILNQNQTATFMYDSTTSRWRLINQVESSGSFTATFDDGCTTSPTVAFLYKKIGTMVHLRWDNMSPTTCTSDSITFDTNSLNEVPASIRPTSAQSSNFMNVIDNSLARTGQVTVSTTGNIQMRLCTTEGGAATGLTCSVNLWTNANLKSIQAGQMSYSTTW